MIKRLTNALAGALLGIVMGLALLAWMPGAASADPCPDLSYCVGDDTCAPTLDQTVCEANDAYCWTVPLHCGP